jgi:uracil-DNA glycosylase
MKIDIPSKLQKLYAAVDACAFCRTKRNPLRHIHGYGAMRPDWMLILVNPTHRNISSAPTYRGSRFPFIGVRQFWNVLANGDLISEAVAGALPARTDWTAHHTDLVQRELIRNKLFLTNVVKCCYDHSAYPAPSVVRESVRHVAEEIRSVRPRRIIAFGGLVHRTLTNMPVTLAAHWAARTKPAYHEKISGLSVPVIPCYFPIGRGSPRKAAKILREVQRDFGVTQKPM